MQLLVPADTTSISYWLNSRFLLCSIIVLLPVAVALYIIWKYEGLGKLKPQGGETEGGTRHDLSDDDVWKPCLKEIHPSWLLAFRVIAFCLALATLIVKVLGSGGRIFYYYTQWTFTLVTIYFGFGSVLSIYGCCRYKKISSDGLHGHHDDPDAEQGYYKPLAHDAGTHLHIKSTSKQEQYYVSQATSISTYVFQVIFQINGGAVMLTDCIYWTIIFPFLTIQDYDLNFMTVNLHTLNAILLFCDAALNRLHFPWFRISYFVVWTGIYVVSQWIIHSFVFMRWPYPFLDLSLAYAPLWYLLVALLHLPCYGVFLLFVKGKYHLLSKWFNSSYS